MIARVESECIAGFCCEYLYRISNMVLPQTVYIRLDKEDKLYGQSSFIVDKTIKVHGGCTFAQFDSEGNFWIGWDYGHVEDFLAGLPVNMEDIYDDIGRTVAQLQNRKIS